MTLPVPTPPAAGGPTGTADMLQALRTLQPEGVSAALVNHRGQRVLATGRLAQGSAFGLLGSGLLMAGDTLVREVGGGRCDHVLVAAAELHIVSMPVGDSAGHVLVLVAPRQLVLGKLLWEARRCCACWRDTEASRAASHPTPEESF